MRSLRTRITLMTVFALILAVVMVTVLGVVFVKRTELRKSDQLLLMLCETGEKNLDYYFNSVQKSVEKVASYTEADLDGLDDEKLERHIKRISEYFDIMAAKTNGVLTYYYRIDPAVSENVKGFWYVNLDDTEFIEHEVTDITQYDTEDTSALVWFTVPKFKGESIWLPPYITDNLDVRVISYNVPIYWRGQFVGVVGIEIDYSTMAEQINSIRLYDNGYAFLSDASGNLFYHPKIDVTQLGAETMPAVPDGAISENTFISYKYNNVKKIGAWLPLSNGMRLNVVVPVSETEGDWRGLIGNIAIVAVEVLAVTILFTMLYTKRIVKPIKQLTEAAKKVDNLDYDFALDYNKDDEIGRLTQTFKNLSSHMKDHIADLNAQVYVDVLTRVKNKGAFELIIEELQEQIDSGNTNIKFAVCIFDCDNLKLVNDRNGHDKGDKYLQTASNAICKVFQHSPVFRIGGDEFAAVLRAGDYHNIDYLLTKFDREIESVNAAAENQWEKANISMGYAIYDPGIDGSAEDVVRRADKNMYENKRKRKSAGQASSR